MFIVQSASLLALSLVCSSEKEKRKKKNGSNPGQLLDGTIKKWVVTE